MDISSSILRESIYYCQTLINQLPQHFLHNINLLFVGLLIFASLLIFLRAIVIVTKEHKLKDKLRSNLTRNQRFEKNINKLDLRNKAYLIKDKKTFAFCLGINPRIYISTALFNSINNKELEAVLRHENYHLKNRDTLFSFIISVTKPFFKLLPILSDIERNYKIDREIKADKEALISLGSKKSLLSVIEKILRAPKFDLNYQMIAGFDAIELRIDALIRDNFKFKSFKRRNILTTFITISLLLLFFMSPVHAIELGSEKKATICASPPLYTPANLSIDNR